MGKGLHGRLVRTFRPVATEYRSKGTAVLNIKTWWAVIRSAAVPRPAGEVSGAARDAELQYCWLLPGDLIYGAGSVNTRSQRGRGVMRQRT